MIGEGRGAGKRRQAGKECMDFFYFFFRNRTQEKKMAYKKQLCMQNIFQKKGIRSPESGVFGYGQINTMAGRIKSVIGSNHTFAANMPPPALIGRGSRGRK